MTAPSTLRTRDPVVPAPDEPLLVPVLARSTHEGATALTVSLAGTAGGEAVGTAFRTAEALVAALGPEVPWVWLPARAVGEAFLAAGVSRVVVDPVPTAADPSAAAGASADPGGTP